MKATILIIMFGAALVCGAWSDGDAADLTGVWTGTQSCKRVDSRGASRTRVQKTFFVSGDYLAFEGEGATYRTHVVGESGSSEVVGLATCGGGPWAAFAGRFKVSTDPRSGKGVMRGATTSSQAQIEIVNGNVTICKWSFKRTSTVDPGVRGCLKEVKVHVVSAAALDNLSVVLAYPSTADFRGPYGCGADRRVRLEERDSGEGHLLLELSPASNSDSLEFPLELKCEFSPVAGSYLHEDSFDAIVLSAEANGLRVWEGVDLVVDVVP